MSTLPTVVAASFALVAFVLLANLILVHYARGVARTSVDEAVRTSAVGSLSSHGPADCVLAASAVLDELLGGSFGSDLTVSCQVSDDLVEASVEGTVPSLVPLLPSFGVSVHGWSAREPG